MRLSPESEAKDALEAMAARRRELPLVLISEQPLRKPAGRKQTRTMGLLRRQLLADVAGQMDLQNRRTFRSGSPSTSPLPSLLSAMKPA